MEEPACCFICLETAPPPILFGCACRTHFVHSECAITRAKLELGQHAWHTCALCKQAATGRMRTHLADAWVSWLMGREGVDKPKHEARLHLARTHIVDGRYADAERIIAEEKRRLGLLGIACPVLYPFLGALMSADAECLKFQGRYAESECIYRKLIASIADESSYEWHCARSGLAQVFLEMGRSSEAAATNQEVFDATRGVLPDESAQMMAYAGNLALAMIQTKRYDEAERMLRKLVEKMTRVLGPVHPDTLTNKGNLALALRHLGRVADALAIQTDILAELTATLGADHPSTLICKANFADSLSCSGRPGSLPRAIQMGREVLDANRGVLGDRHSDTLMCAANLAGMMIKTGDRGSIQEAEQILRTVVSFLADPATGMPLTCQISLGASTMLADCLYKRGKKAEAVDVMRGLASALDRRASAASAASAASQEQEQEQEQAACIICLESGPAPIQRGCACRGDAGLSHIECMVRLAESRDETGRVSEMQGPGAAWVICLTCGTHFTGVMKQELALAWSERSRTLPVDHLQRVRSDQHRAECLHAAGKYAEAAKLARSTLAQYTRLLGYTHPLALYSSTILCNSLFSMGKYVEAEKAQREVLAATRRVLGPRDIVTASQMSALANTLGRQRKFPEAVRLARDAVAILRADGATDGATDGDQEKMFLTAASVLAHLFGEQGDHAGARALWCEVLSAQARVLGPEHPDTLQTKANLAATISRQGSYDEAKRLEIDVLRAMRRVLGPAHALTLEVEANLRHTLRCAQEARTTRGPVPVVLTSKASKSKADSEEADKAVKADEAVKAEGHEISVRLGPRCSNPECTKDGPRPCSRCRVASYCTPECQKAHWKAHKPSCRHPVG